MSEHLTEQQIEQFANRQKGPSTAELLDVDEHLAGCPECRAKALTAAGITPSSISLQHDDDLDHPEHEQLAGYVDGSLGDVDKEIVEGHIEYCDDCAAEVAELQSFRKMLSVQPNKSYTPDSAAGIFQRMDAGASSSKSASTVRRPVYRFAPAFALAASILIAAVVVWQIGGKNRNMGMDSGYKPVQVAKEPKSESPIVTPPSIPSTPAPAPEQKSQPVQPEENVTEPSTSAGGNATKPSNKTDRGVSGYSTYDIAPAPAPSAPGMPGPSSRPALEKPAKPEPALPFSMNNIGSARPAEHADKDNAAITLAAPAPPVVASAAAPEHNGLVDKPVDKKVAQSAPVGAARESRIEPGFFGGEDESVSSAPNPMAGAGGGGMAVAPARAAKTAYPVAVENVIINGHLNLDTPEIRQLTAVDYTSSVGQAPVSFSVTSPVSTAVLSGRPTFTWEQAKDATAYQVTITDRDGNDVATSPSLTSTAWRSDKPLPTGQVLKWQVTATENGQTTETSPNGGARFRVLDPDRAAQIRDAQKTFADQPLALGILYAQAGMLDEAQRALQQARKQDPQNEIVPKLLSDLKAVRENSGSL